MPQLSPQVFNLLNASNRLFGLAPLPDVLLPKPLPLPGALPGAPVPSTGARSTSQGVPWAAPQTVTQHIQGAYVRNRPWINAVLKQLGAPATKENVRFLDAWGRAEGGGGYSGTGEGQFNWLNTMRGTTSGWNQANFETGVRNTVGALTNGLYDPIVNALKSGKASATAMAQMVANSPWGTHSGVLRTLGSEPQPLYGTRTITTVVKPQVNVQGFKYVNPIPPGSVRNRTDQGVDFQAPPGSPIRAIGDAQVVSISNDPGGFGRMLVYQLLSGPLKGRYVFVGHTVPTVQAGQRVKAGQTVTVAHQAPGSSAGDGWVEIGYASGPSLTQARQRGELRNNPSHGDTLSGKQFLALLRHLGIK